MENKKTKKWFIIVITLFIGYWAVNNVSILQNVINIILNILSPFIFGACLAFILNIPMSFFEKKLLRIKNCKKHHNKKNSKGLRILSIIFAVLVIILILTLIINLIVPELIKIIKMLIDNIPYYSEKITEFFEKCKNNMPDIVSIIQNVDINTEEIKGQMLNQMTGLLTSSISIITNIINAVTNFIIEIIFAVYILLDKEKLQNQAKKLLYAYLNKEKADKIYRIAKITNNTFKNFFTVQCLEATILGSLCIIGMLILNLPYAIPIGILIGVTALIPIVGAFLGVIIGAILILSVEPIKVITFVIFFLVLQQIEGNLIYPRVVGNSVGLPGMWVLLAVTVGGKLIGILGMVLGVPTASIIYTLLKEDVNTKISKIENE